MSNLPKDPVILLSYVNTQLRDHYSSLDALCEDKDENEEEICAALAVIGYVYDAESNKFI